MMTTVSMVWLASIAGALLFAAAGFCAGLEIQRRRRAKTQPLPLPLPTVDPREIERAVDDAIRSSRAMVEDQAQIIRRLQGEIAAHEAESARALHVRQDRVTLERANADASSAEAAKELSRCQREIVAAKARLTEMMTRESNDKKRIAQLEADVSRFTKELDVAVKKERRAAEILDTSRSRERQIEGQLATARKEVEALRRKPAAAAATVATSQRQSEDDAVEASSRKLDDNASLRRFVDDMVKTPSVSAAALTDELGFLVVGAGDNTEALAAFGAYLTDAGARACGLLPMHAVHRVSIQDDEGITLTARTIATTPSDLVLVTLGVSDISHTQQQQQQQQQQQGDNRHGH